ncbi:MAG: cupin domain-containing protein [bacterium]|nr:cupin domain-containing protein [bacterium]
MPVTDWDKLPTKIPFPGVEPKIVSGEHVMICYVNAKKGATTVRHHHEAEQIFCLLSGSVRVQSGEEPVVILKPGDVWYVPSHVEHQADYLEDTVAFEACSPIRKDNFGGYLHQDTHMTKQRDLAALMKKQNKGGK